ncbi:MAG: 2-hydroxyacid dehydrogenase [Phenylobacterium sp.]|uniref:2-hydroxyacid dehydrogenase n=1 Tax=Phenylobacterium sp. TaxID=1871053 RepID=UPI003919462A
MRVAVFSARRYDEVFLGKANRAAKHQLTFFESPLTPHTQGLLAGFEAACVFVNDVIDAKVLRHAAAQGVRLVVLRAAGFNNVDLEAARDAGVHVARAPTYSPHAVAEHALALMLTLNRKTHRAYNRVREGNFALDGLMGFDLHGKTAGVVGAGAIGGVMARLLKGFGCHVLASDPVPDAALARAGVEFVAFDDLLAKADLISLHCPLTAGTRRLIDTSAITRMTRGVMLINTSRGAVIDTRAVIRALKAGVIGSLGIDVYEEEEGLFFDDRSDQVIADDVFARLLTFPNVLVTGHQGFFTAEALTAIAEATIGNVTAFERNGHALHEVPHRRS